MAEGARENTVVFHTAAQPTVSYYGSALWNWLSLNELLHVEHHDLSGVPWTRLPELTRAVPGLYHGADMVRVTSLYGDVIVPWIWKRGAKYDFACREAAMWNVATRLALGKRFISAHRGRKGVVGRERASERDLGGEKEHRVAQGGPAGRRGCATKENKEYGKGHRGGESACGGRKESKEQGEEDQREQTTEGRDNHNDDLPAPKCVTVWHMHGASPFPRPHAIAWRNNTTLHSPSFSPSSSSSAPPHR